VTPLRRLQRTVHAACRELGLDDEDRRGLQLVATGKASMADMDEDELKAVLKALEKRGFRPGGRRPAAPRADLRLAHALWGRLGRAGKLKRPGRAGLNAFVRSRFGEAWGSVPVDIDALRDAEQINAVVEALKTICRREGVAVDRGRR
jgi:phage gp16-like protein